MNGNREGDEEGEWTYMGPGEASVVDYAIENQKGWEKIKSFKVREIVESDHQPLETVGRR